ncbi:MAG: hypothetical protein ABI700_11135 [Chloroflexota bacterium]
MLFFRKRGFALLLIIAALSAIFTVGLVTAGRHADTCTAATLDV